MNNAINNLYPKLVASGTGSVSFRGIWNHWYMIMTNHAFGGASLTFWTPRGTIDNPSNINKLFGNPTIHTNANNDCTVTGNVGGCQIEVYELKAYFA